MNDLSDISTLDDDAQPVDVDLDAAPADPSVAINVGADGSVTVNFGGGKKASKDSKFDDNLAEHLDESTLNALGSDLKQAIDEDDQSRSQWLERTAEGMKLLALELEKPSDTDMRSKARSTLLLEAVLRFQANASGELLPTDGPAKIRNDNQGSDSVDSDTVADYLEKDLNHYLTVIATEYAPDTERMLFSLGYCGSGFKKVYRDPIRRRPVSESVNAEDVIVSNSATDLRNADRVTHRVKMRPRVLKRMQKLGVYRDIVLTTSMPDENKNAVHQARDNISGQSSTSIRPEEQDNILLECYCQLDIEGFEHKDDSGEPDGLPLPYKVVIEESSGQVLEIRRNWSEDDEMQQAKETFVEFTFVPGIGFYGIGLLQICGNPTSGATALLRCGIDASTFANFPGFLFLEEAGRQDTLTMNVMPGQGLRIKSAADDIRKTTMPLPYKSPDGTLLEIYKELTESGSRVAGTAEIQVGEGRQDAPVGTTIAMIEQAVKIMDAVHKRLVRSQGRELSLLRDLFRENPEDFWRFNKKPATKWTQQIFEAGLQDNDFVPAADPNTASSVQRVARAQALYQMATQAPDRFNLDAVQKIVLRTLNFNNPESLMNNAPPAPPPPDPKAEAAKLSAQADMMKAQAAQTSAQIQGSKIQSDTQIAQAKLQGDQQQASAEMQRSQVIHETELKQSSLEASANLEVAREKANADIVSAHAKQVADIHADHTKTLADLASDHALQAKQHKHEMNKSKHDAALAPKHETKKKGD